MEFKVKLKIYPFKAVLKTANLFLNRVFISFDQELEDELIIKLKARQTEDNLEKIKDEFLNELVNQLLRQSVSDQNQKLREYIVSATLLHSLPKEADEILKEVDSDSWQDDPEGIREIKQ